MIKLLMRVSIYGRIIMHITLGAFVSLISFVLFYLGKFFQKENLSRLTAICTLLSIILVWATLNEMQTQRNQAYKPDVIIEGREMVILESSFRTEPIRNEQGTNWEKLNDLLNIDGNADITFKMYNAGMGGAKNIRIVWERDNYKKLMDLYETIDTNGVYNKRDIVKLIREFTYPYNHFAEYVEDEEFHYIKPNASDIAKVNFPLTYYILLKSSANSGEEIARNKLWPISKVDLNAELCYTDIQGNEYHQRIVFHFVMWYFTSRVNDKLSIKYKIQIEYLK